jgi:hypothetical protein
MRFEEKRRMHVKALKKFTFARVRDEPPDRASRTSAGWQRMSLRSEMTQAALI